MGIGHDGMYRDPKLPDRLKAFVARIGGSPEVELEWAKERAEVDENADNAEAARRMCQKENDVRDAILNRL